MFLVPRRLSLMADTLAHMALAGVALGLFLGISPVLGAFVVTVLGAIGIERLRSRGALRGDAALAVFLSGGFALAVVLISLARGFNADLFAVLFGSILTVSPDDIWVILALGGRRGRDRRRSPTGSSSRSRCTRTWPTRAGCAWPPSTSMLTLLTALTTVVAMRMVGVLLVSAMIVIPALTGFTLGRSFRRATGWAVLVALVSVTVGLVAAFYLRLAAGGAIVLTALLLYALVSSIERGRARLARRTA